MCGSQSADKTDKVKTFQETETVDVDSDILSAPLWYVSLKPASKRRKPPSFKITIIFSLATFKL